MRAAEHQRVDVGVADGREQALGEHVHLVGVDVAGLDELDESRAGRARERRRRRVASRWYAPDAIVPTVPITPTRPRAGDAGRGAQPRLDHADHRDVEPLPQHVERGGGGAVARHHERLHVAPERARR